MVPTTRLKHLLAASFAAALCTAAPAIAQPMPDAAADVPTCNGSNNDHCVPRGGHGMGGGHHRMMHMHRHMAMHHHMHGHMHKPGHGHHKPHHKPHPKPHHH